MRLRTIVKLGTILSVILFCMAVGFYAFTQLENSGYNRHVNLFSFVPSHCNSVLETDNVYEFMNEISKQGYSNEFEKNKMLGQFHFIFKGLNEFADRKPHGVGSLMNKMLISFHDSSFNLQNRVIYICLEETDKKLLGDILLGYTPSGFLPKKEEYRGKELVIYPLGSDNYLTSYSEDGIVVLSLQKRLIEQAVDANQDHKSLNDDPIFSNILQKKKSKNNLALYVRTSALPFLKADDSCWSEYDFHFNSDVFYLTGESYMPDTVEISLKDMGKNSSYYEKENIFFSVEKDIVAYYMDKMYEEDTMNHTLFMQCLANLSREASFTLVADVQGIALKSSDFSNLLPMFVRNNIPLFNSFILSLQYFNVGDRLSHIWVFTYKN